MSLRLTRALAALAVVNVLSVSACSSQQEADSVAPPAAASQEPAAAPESTTPNESPTPGGTPAGSTTTPAKPHAALADGRWPAFLTDVGAGEVTLDLVEFLTGDAAVAAWKKDNPNSAADGPDGEEFYIVNDNKKKRVMPVSGSVKVRVVGGVGPEADTPASLADLKDMIPRTLFWLTVKKGKITRIEEQYLP